MKVIVFGGTGSVGRLVVEQATYQGDEVTVFTRSLAARRAAPHRRPSLHPSRESSHHPAP